MYKDVPYGKLHVSDPRVHTNFTFDATLRLLVRTKNHGTCFCKKNASHIVGIKHRKRDDQHEITSNPW